MNILQNVDIRAWQSKSFSMTMPVHKVRQIFMMQKVEKYEDVINRSLI